MKKRRKSKKSKEGRRIAGLRRAKYELGIWSDYLEFIRFLNFHGRPVSRGQARFTADEWEEYSSRTTGEGKEDTIERRFERWKAKVRKLEPRALLAPEEGGEYQASPELGQKLAQEARERVEFFIRASGREVPVPKETAPAFVRDKPIKDVFRNLEIPYSGGKVRQWASMGMPVNYREKGTRTFLYGDTAEVFEWVHQAIAAGDILDPFRAKLPVSEAMPRVQRAMEALKKHRVSKTQIAKLLGITRGKLESYEKNTKLRSIPRDVVIGLEKLVKEGLPDIRRRAPKAGVPPLAEVRSAVAEAGGNLTHAEGLLREKGYTHGVTGSNLSQIAKQYGIPVHTRRVIEPTKEELLAELKKHKYRIDPTAKSFGFSWSPLQRLIDKYDLRHLVEAHGRGKITVHDLIDASNAGEFVTTEAAALLEVHPAHFRSLLDKHGILEWFDQEHEKKGEKSKAGEREALKAEIVKAVQAQESRNDLAKRLGMTRTHLESRVKILGLKEDYAQLVYDRSFKGGRERDIAPEETERVPFWMAALRDLRARYPGRGGGRKLAKALGYGNATISNWLSGKRVPGLPQIERIVSEAGHPMPDWRGALGQLIQAEGSGDGAARALGVRSVGNILSGRVFPSEKLLERILGPGFWVSSRAQPDTGYRPGISMGEVPPDVAKTHLAAAMARLMGTVRSQRELAGLLGVSTASISRFMRAKTAAPPPQARDAIVALYRERFGEDPEGIMTQHSGHEALDRALGLFPTQAALAEELGLARGHLSRIIHGSVTMSPQVHARLEELLRDMSDTEVTVNPPRFDVRSPAQGLRAIQHPEITRNWEKALRVKPKHKKAVLVPCAGTKPFPEAPSHKHGYMKALDGKDLDVYVVSEPLGVVPYSWSRKYPQESYDFPPAHLRGQARDLLVDRIAAWFDRVAPQYKKVYLALPAHHRRLVLHALEQFDGPPTKIKDVGLGACLEAGACPPGHFRPTSEAYRGFLKARTNPDEPRRRFERAAAAGDQDAARRHFLERWRREGVPFSMDGLEDYLEAFPGQAVVEMAEFWSMPARNIASMLSRLGTEGRAHSDVIEVMEGFQGSPGSRRKAWKAAVRGAKWYPGPDYKSYYLPDLLGEASILVSIGRSTEVRIRALKAAARMIKAAIRGLEGLGLADEAEFSRAYFQDTQELIDYLESGGKWGMPQREAIPWLSGNLRGESRWLYQVVPQDHPPIRSNPCLPCVLPMLGALGTGAILLREDSR